jgi:hypothetical protein
MCVCGCVCTAMCRWSFDSILQVFYVEVPGSDSTTEHIEFSSPQAQEMSDLMTDYALACIKVSVQTGDCRRGLEPLCFLY